MEQEIIMKALLLKKIKWEKELSITDPSDPHSNMCRQEIANADLQISVAEANTKKSSKKSSKKSTKETK